ncbi:MAG: hypothetical protein Q9168_006840 [Polycauliona sp. 1 TL-2023]
MDQLSLSTNLKEDVKLTAESLGEISGHLRQILKDPRTPYVIFRLFAALPHALVHDIDEAILASEKHVRSQHPKPGNFLVTLKDLTHVLGPPDERGIVTFVRPDPSQGSFQFLDQERKQVMQIVGTDKTFMETFRLVTNGCLDQLDWQNIIIAGGMVLNTLLLTDRLDGLPASATPTNVSDCDIDLYLYDLTPEEANRKIEHIYDVWYSHNLQHGGLSGHAVDQMIVKTRQTITLIPIYPFRRIQIVLKILQSPADILLNFDLDACAFAFDGSRVSMLPRAARALETGYSTFTMDLIWGHHLGHRRESQEVRVFKYANRGFGLRILPSYIQSLESGSSEDIDQDAHGSRKGPTRLFDREPGLKTLTRIAHLARNFVKGYCGRQPLFHGQQRPLISLAAMDGYAMYEGLPDLWKGLPIFEVFMRHCEAWKMDAKGDARLDWDSFSSIAYDEQNEYDGLPTYHWGPNALSFGSFEQRLDDYNNRLFYILRKVIAEKLNIGPRDGRYFDYLTRRIRRTVVGGELKAVQRQQITMPLIIPMDLQLWIDSELIHRNPDVKAEHLPSLIRVHDPTKYDPRTATVPSLADTLGTSGNLRYWLITNENMWAGRSRVGDEVSELLTTLFDWFLHCEQQHSDGTSTRGTDSHHCIWHLAKLFRRRLALPDESDKRERGELLSKREARLFRPWALTRPPRVKRSYDEEGEMDELEDEMEEEGDVPDGAFWTE